MGRLLYHNRSLAEDGLQDVWGMSALRRPKQSGDLGPMGACHATTVALRKIGCKTSGGRLFCNDRSGAETLDPWGQGSLPLLKLKRAKP